MEKRTFGLNCSTEDPRLWDDDAIYIPDAPTISGSGDYDGKKAKQQFDKLMAQKKFQMENAFYLESDDKKYWEFVDLVNDMLKPAPWYKRLWTWLTAKVPGKEAPPGSEFPMLARTMIDS